MPSFPEYKGRSPDSVISERVFFDSVGYLYRALSWLDIAQRSSYNICALQYAALDTRQATEQLLFEEIFLSVGTQLDRLEYRNMKGNSTKLHKTLGRLNPHYKKLLEFTKAIMAVYPEPVDIVEWDPAILMKNQGKASQYLHWAGEPLETFESEEWINSGIRVVSDATQYMLDNFQAGHQGVMLPENMQPEIRNCWEQFKEDAIDLNAVRRIAHIASPILERRLRQSLL